ncbi:MAG: PaaI family thioesterase [Pirellulales bacterium]|nr:PaaI family thioesterase [Pirellulales bacterium]
MDDPLPLIQQAMKGLLPDLLGMEFTLVTPERVVATLTVRPELCTVGGILHGGAIMAFADTLGATATVINLQGGSTTTIESKTNFLRAAPAGTVVTGETTPLHRGGTTMVWQTRVTTADGKLVANVVQTQLVLKGK